MTIAAAPLPTERPRCPDHPDRIASRTCGRCGRFVCDECEGGGTCVTCQRHLAAALPSSARRAKVTVAFLRLHIVSDLAMGLVGLWVLASPGGEELVRDLLETVAGLGLLAAVFGTVIGFLMWLHSAYVQARALGGDPGMTPGWAVGWWFIPFANLVKPYHAVRGLLWSIGGESLVARAWLPAWWACWLIGNFLSNIETRMTFSVPLDEPAPVAVYAVSLGSSTMSILAAWLCIRIVRFGQAAIDARRGQ